MASVICHMGMGTGHAQQEEKNLASNRSANMKNGEEVNMARVRVARPWPVCVRVTPGHPVGTVSRRKVLQSGVLFVLALAREGPELS